MSGIINFEKKTKFLIDELKSVCANAGLGNDGNEYKVITQVFLYKFLNDKFLFEIKKLQALDKKKNIEEYLSSFNKKDYELLLLQINENTARFNPNQLIGSIFKKQEENNFAKIFDENLIEISKNNSEIFSIVTSTGQKITIFENLSKYVDDNKDKFCKALINKLVNFSFEEIFDQGFDFFSIIFEYLIKDYNSNSGGKYAEYFTPHSVSKIMASCLVPETVSNVSCYDPSAGSGTLLMNLANKIGENKCIIHSQDISQKSSQLLRLNLILNNLVHSLPNIIQGNTLSSPFHIANEGSIQKFDFVVSNPPFKLDFSEYRNDLDNKKNKERFFAGIPNIPKKKKEKMPIYLMFIQHILYSLNDDGKAAIVVPTGFLSGKGIDFKIRKHLIDNRIINSIISMPSNIFATTGTNVSILFINKEKKSESIKLIDASNLGEEINDGDNLKTFLSEDDENQIINAYNSEESITGLLDIIKYEQIIEKKYSLNPGMYRKVKIDIYDWNEDEFKNILDSNLLEIDDKIENSKKSLKDIKDLIKKFKYDF